MENEVGECSPEKKIDELLWKSNGVSVHQVDNTDFTIRRRLLSKRTTAHAFHLTLALSREGANVSE